MEGVRKMLAGAGYLLTGEREFTCGDCDRWRRCGLPPTDDCPMRGEQIARYGERRQMRDIVIASELSRTYGRRFIT